MVCYKFYLHLGEMIIAEFMIGADGFDEAIEKAWEEVGSKNLKDGLDLGLSWEEVK